MALPNARTQYLKTQIETASKEQLVVMLFDGIIRFTEQARAAINNKDVEASHHALMRAQAIIMELLVTVDKEKGGEVANNLLSLHAYAFNCLIVCNMKKDVEKIDEVQGIYRELRDAWVGAMDTLGLASGAGKPLGGGPSGGKPAPATLSGPAGKPAAPGVSGPGLMASARAAPQAGGYGMGKTASMPLSQMAQMIGKAAAAPASQPAAAKPATSGMNLGAQFNTPAAEPTIQKPAGNAQQNAMLKAYGNTRSIA